MNDVTKILARWIVGVKAGDIPAPVRREGVRTFVNWLGCAVGGARHEAVDCALAALVSFSGPPRAAILGRGERMDELHAALVNGIASHVHDFDDTHLKTIIHPAGPVACALLAIAESRYLSGADFLTALIVGIEVECRIGNCVYPDHYDRGWHITGTAGVFGAAAAAGKMLGLNELQMTWALGIAATQSSGFREMFGTMCKSFHPGKAAQNGAASAFMAKAGFDSSLRAIEAPRGFANVMSIKQDYAEITEGLGNRWEAALNTYKPFACGIVIHPAIDGCRQIFRTDKPALADIVAVNLLCHPLVQELTSKPTPQTGLEGKFSVFHAAAFALLHGDGDQSAFTDAAVRDPDVIALRSRVHLKTDSAVHEAACNIVVALKDGRKLKRQVTHAVGSLEKPLADAELSEKFAKQADAVLGKQATGKLIDLAWQLETLPDMAAISKAAAL